MFSPAKNTDRIAELETTVRRLEAALEGSRRAAAETVIFHQVRTARTALRQESPVYPAVGAVEAPNRLPIVFTDWHTELDTDSAVLEIVPRSAYPLAHALCPLWLPPLVDVDVAWDGKRWRIIRWPTILYCKSDSPIPAASWVDCNYWTPGGTTGYVQIWRRVTGQTRWEAQWYDESQTLPVELKVYNTGGSDVAANKMLELIPDVENGRWIVVIEPCAGECQ